MSTEFDPGTGTLVADAAELDALVRCADAPPSPCSSELRALRRADAVDARGQPHPALDPAVRALRRPEAGVLSLTYAGRTMHGWRGADSIALLMPADGIGRRALVTLWPSLLPEGIARAVDLAPRPRSRAPTTVDALADDPTVNRWWRLAVACFGPNGRSGGSFLDVVDTFGGLYTVETDRSVLPTTPTGVWRLLVRIVARTRRDGLRPLPPEIELPQPWI